MFSSLLGLSLLFASPPAADGPAPADPPREPAIVHIEAPAPRGPAFETFEGDPIGVQRIVLDNGLTVLLSENHEKPQVFGAVVVRTGGKNDPPDNTGMAHYLEHMLFKGTRELGTSDWAAEEPLQREIVSLYDALGRAKSEERAKIHAQIGEVVEQTYAYAIPNELDTLLEEMGGAGINAFTNEDETVYHNSVPSSQVEAWLQVYGHRFQDPVFRLFPTELEAVYEEKNISMDRFETKIFETFIERAFPSHPYGTQTVIGDVEHLKRPSLSAMREYFETYYVANNMALVLCGDFDADRIMPIIEREFGSWRSGPQPQQVEGVVESFDGAERIKARLTPVRVGALAYRTVAEGHPDHPAISVLRQLLTNEQGSGLLDQLVDQGKLMIVFPVPVDNADHGLELVFFAPRLIAQTFHAAEKIVHEQYRKLARGDFDEDSFEAARRSVLSELESQWETNEGRAMAMGHSFTTGLGWGGVLAQIEDLRALDKDEVARVAATYFGDDRLQLRSRVGFPSKQKLQKPHYPAVEPTPGAESSFARQLRSRPQTRARLQLVDFELETVEVAPGVTLHRNENPFNERYTLELRFGVGSDELRELDVLQEYLLELGAGRRSASAFKEELSRLDTTFEIEATLDRFVVRVDGPQQNMSAALTLVNDLMRAPVADKKALARLRKQRWGRRRVARRNPRYIANALFDYALLGQRSSYLRAYGPRSMRRLAPDELLRAWSEVQGYEVELRYVGRESAERVAAELETVEFGSKLRAAKAKVIYDRRLAERATVYFVPNRKAIQTHIYFALEGDPIPEAERAAADAYNEYLGGGMGGLIFQEIREFRALAYSTAGGWYSDPRPDNRGWVAAYVGCQADKTFEAADVMLGLLQDMPRKPERIDTVRGALQNSMETRSPGFRALQSWIEGWGWLGYDEDPRTGRLAAYDELEFGDIERFFEEHVEGRAVTLMVVGDPRRVDRDRLGDYGEVVEVREKALFSP